MTTQEFKTSLSQSTPPPQIDPLLQALWYDGKGDWDAAHHVAQDINTDDGAWVHAYLHRKEGDLGNATYWYKRALKKMPNVSLEKEWEEIVKSFLTPN